MSRISAFFARVAGLFDRNRRDADLTAELEAHLQFHIDDNIRAGMPPGEASRQAMLRHRPHSNGSGNVGRDVWAGPKNVNVAERFRRGGIDYGLGRHLRDHVVWRQPTDKGNRYPSGVRGESSRHLSFGYAQDSDAHRLECCSGSGGSAIGRSNLLERGRRFRRARCHDLCFGMLRSGRRSRSCQLRASSQGAASWPGRRHALRVGECPVLRTKRHPSYR
jgi:hypothetical protein